MRIVGGSFNGPEKNAAWAQDQGFPYALWSDRDKVLAKHYGAVRISLAPVPGRITVVLDAQGRQVLAYDDVNVGTHPADVLEDCRVLFGAE